MELKRDIVVYDLETTGLDITKDRIVQFAAIKMQSGEKIDLLINPEIEISEEATKIHHITNEQLLDKPKFKDVAKQILDFIKDCDIAGYNILRFDLPLLCEEFNRVGIVWDYSKHKIVDVFNIFKLKEKRNLEAAVRFYLDKEIEGYHDALHDAINTKDVLVCQFGIYDEFRNIKDAAYYSNYSSPLLDPAGKFTLNKKGMVVFAFGKYKGQPIEEHLDYIEWMAKSNFPATTLLFANDTLNDVFNKTAINEMSEIDDEEVIDDLPF